MNPTIAITGLTRRYGDHVALDDVTVEIDGPSVTGLIGRNGSGKTTLLRVLAGQEFASAGTVRVLGAPAVENDAILRRMVFVREDQQYPQLRVRDALRVASWCHPNWSPELAAQLVAEFELPPRRWVARLSRGMRSALGVVIGLAARAEVTLFDEPYAGLDAVARRLFYDRLLADYAEYPRTIVLSTHLVDEIAGLLDRVVMLDGGRVLLDVPADAIRGVFTTVSGPAAAVEAFVAGRPTWERRRLASHETVVVAGALEESDREWARSLHLTVEPLSLQQVMVQTSEGTRA